MSQELNIEELLVQLKNELKNLIEASEARILLKIVETINDIGEVRSENVNLKRELELLKRNQLKNNVVIFGLKTGDQFSPDSLCNKINDLLEIDISVNDLNNTYKLGEEEDSPIKIEFISYLKKKCVLDNCNKLKGKKIFIRHDQTPSQREHFKILRKHLLLARQDGIENCYIKGGKLYVQKEVYEPQDLLALENIKRPRRNSAPPTPEPKKDDKSAKLLTKVTTQLTSKSVSTNQSVSTSVIKPKSTTPSNRMATRKNSAK